MAGYLNTAVNKVVGPATLLSASGFGAITWVSLNNKNLSVGDTSFITIAAKQQNTGMGWANNNTTVNGNWGSGPISQFPLNVSLRLGITGSCLLVHTLNTEGQRVATKSLLPVSTNTFDVSFDQSTDKTLWYGLEMLSSNTTQWTGAVSNDWFNSANWCCGQVPGPLSNVVINNGKPNYPMVTADIIIWSIRVNVGAVFNVAAGVKVTAQGQ